MTKKPNPKDKLRNPQLTVYLDMELQEWLKAYAEQESKDTGEQVSVSQVLRRILRKIKEST